MRLGQRRTNDLLQKQWRVFRSFFALTYFHFLLLFVLIKLEHQFQEEQLNGILNLWPLYCPLGMVVNGTLLSFNPFCAYQAYFTPGSRARTGKTKTKNLQLAEFKPFTSKWESQCSNRSAAPPPKVFWHTAFSRFWKIIVNMVTSRKVNW